MTHFIVLVDCISEGESSLFLLTGKICLLGGRYGPGKRLAQSRLEWQICRECDWQVKIVPSGTFQTHTVSDVCTERAFTYRFKWLHPG